MKHKLNRLTALLLAVVMTFSVLLVPVEAASFADVSGKAWYKSAVDFVSEKGFMAGVSEAQFAPNANMTRAMFVTVLASFSDVETKGEKTLFSDVPANRWYTGAVTWAAQNGLVSGVGDGRFAPNASITRQDLCTVLAKFLSMEDMTLTRSKDTSFQDEEQISSYAKEAVRFCAQTGLVSGFDDGSFRPKETATRAQVAAILQKLYGLTGGVPLRPAQMLHSKADASMAVTVDAPRGALPEDTDLTVTRVTDEATLAELAKKANGKLIAAADITFSKSGAELEPKTEVEVQIALDGLEDVKNPTVCHVRADGTLEYVSSEQVSLNRSAGSKALRFCAKDFSVYAVLDTPANPTVTVKFYDRNGTLLNEQIISVKRLENAVPDDLIVYDPGISSVSESEEFDGWATTSGATEGKTIEKINEELVNTFKGTGNKPLEVSYYPVVHTVARLRYLDQTGEVLDVETYRFPTGSMQVDVSRLYTPLASNQFFTNEWVVKTEATTFGEGKNSVPSNYGNGAKYAVGSKITLNAGETVDLIPELQTGGFVFFDMNITAENARNKIVGEDTPARYLAPVFAESGGTVTLPTANDSTEANRPYREGYTFGGWYRTSDTRIDQDNKITTTTVTIDSSNPTNITVYAKWVPAEVTYYIIHEHQSLSDVVDLPDSQKTFDYYSLEKKKAYTGSWVSLDSADLKDADGYFFTFNANRSTSSRMQVRGDGSTILRAKYDRRVITAYIVDREYLETASNYESVDPDALSLNDLYRRTDKLGVEVTDNPQADDGFVYLHVNQSPTNYSTPEIVNGKVTYNEEVSSSQAVFMTEMPTSSVSADAVKKLKIPATDNQYFITHRGLYGQWFEVGNVLPNEGSPDYERLFHWEHEQNGYRLMFNDKLNAQSNYLYDTQLAAVEPDRSTLFYIVRKHHSSNDRHVYAYVMDKEGNYKTGYVGNTHAWINPVDTTIPFEHQAVQRLRNKPFTLKYVALNTADYYPTSYSSYRYDTRNPITLTGGAYNTTTLQIVPSTAETEGYVYYLAMGNIHFWWERDQYTIEYVTNGGRAVDSIERYYEADVSDAGNPVPTRTDYLFLGWYADEALTVPWEDYAEKIGNKMPIDGFALYAKWAPLQYRVHLNYFHSDDADSADEVRFAARSYQTTWLLRTGEKIPIPDNRLATRPGYVFDGWYYKDSAGNEKPFSEDTVVSGGLADEDYGKQKSGESEAAFQYRMRVYGERTGVDQVTGVPYDDRWNDNNPERKAIVGRIELYARWRKVTYEGLGIQVRYLPNASDDVSGSFADGTPIENDGTHLEKEKYNDGDTAFGYPASTAQDEKLRFRYWEILDSEGNRTGTKVYPGNSFEIDIEDAMRERTYELGYAPNYTEKLKHTHTLTAVAANTVATCSQPAHEAGWYCAGCDTYFTDNQGENIMTVTGGEHNWEKISQTGYCTEAGTSTMRCSYCGREKVVARAAGNHTLSSENKLPTCTEAGYTGGSHCTVPGCGYSEESRVVPALGHDWVYNDDVIREPTCTEAGWGSAHCSRCDATITDYEIPALGHSYSLSSVAYNWEKSSDNGSTWQSIATGGTVNYGKDLVRCHRVLTCTHSCGTQQDQDVEATLTTSAVPTNPNVDVDGTYSASFTADPGTSQATLNVKLHLAKYKVVLVDYSGATQTVEVDPGALYATPSNYQGLSDGSTFIGWTPTQYAEQGTEPTDLINAGGSVTVNADMTLYAVYRLSEDYFEQITSKSDVTLPGDYVVTSGTADGSRVMMNTDNYQNQTVPTIGNAGITLTTVDGKNRLTNVGTNYKYTFSGTTDRMVIQQKSDAKYVRYATVSYQPAMVASTDTLSSDNDYWKIAANTSGKFAFRTCYEYKGKTYFVKAENSNIHLYTGMVETSNTAYYYLYLWKNKTNVSFKTYTGTAPTATPEAPEAVSSLLKSSRGMERSEAVSKPESVSESAVAPEVRVDFDALDARTAEAAAQTNTATPKVNVTPKGNGEQTGHKLTVLYRYRNDENELVPFQYKDYGEAARGLEFHYEANENYCLLNPEFLGYTAETKLTQGKMPDSDLTVTVVYTRNQIEAPANEKWVLETSNTLDPNEEYLIVAVNKTKSLTVGMLQAKQTGSNLVGAAPNFRHILMSEKVNVTPGWMALPQPLGNTLLDSRWTAMNEPGNYPGFYIDSAYEFGNVFAGFSWTDGNPDSVVETFDPLGWTNKTVDLKSCIWKVRQVEGGGYVIDSALDPNYHLTWDDSGVFPSNTDSDIWYYDSTNNSLKTQFTSASGTSQIYLDVNYALDAAVLNTFTDDLNFTVQHVTVLNADVKYDAHPYAFIQPNPENVDDLNSKVFFFKRDSAVEHTVVLRDDKGVAFTSFTVPDGGILSNYMPSTVAPEGYTVKSWTEADGTEYEVSSGNGAMMSQAVPTRGGFQTNGFDSVTVNKNMDFTAEYEPHFTQTYEIQLRATYGPYNEDGKTHIYWYANNGTDKNNGGGARVMDTAVVPYESAVQIPVPSAATTPGSVPGMLTENRVFYEGISGRGSSDVETGVDGDAAEVGLNYEGHIFLGWVKFDEENNEIGEAHEELRTLNPNDPDDMAKLALIWDGEKYTYNPDIMVPKGYVGETSGDGPNAAVNPTRGPAANGTEYETATVKADSTFPYQKFVAAYAVKVDYFYIFHSATGVLERRELNYQDVDDGNGGTVRKTTPVDLTTAVAPGHRYGGYYHTYGGVNTNKIQEQVENPNATWETSGLSTSASGLIALIDALERKSDNLTQADTEKIVEELSTNKTLILISKLLGEEMPDEKLQHFPKEDLIEAVTNPNGAFSGVDVDELLQNLDGYAQWTEERATNFLSKFPANELISDITGKHENASGDLVPNLDDEKVNALIELLDDAGKLTDSQKSDVLSMFHTEAIDSLTAEEKNALIRSIDNTVDPTAWTEEQKNSFLNNNNVTGTMLHAVLTPAREKAVIEAVVNPSGWNGADRNDKVSDFLNLFTSDELADRLIKVLPDKEADDMIERLVENTKISPTAKKELLDSFTGSELATALVETMTTEDFNTAFERFADLETSSSYWTNDKMEQILSTFSGASVVNALLTTDGEQGEQAVVTIDELKLIFETVGYPNGYDSETIGNANIFEITDALSELTTEEIQKLDTLTNQGVTGILETAGVDGFGFVPYEGAKTFTQDSTNKNFWTKSQAYNVANATTEIPAEDINGQTMRPVKDTVYYLKEVPEVYLSSKYYFTYKNGETGDLSTATIRGISMVTLVDDTYYKQYGFNVDNLTDVEGYVTYKGTATSKFRISKTGDGTQTQSINVTAATFGADAGYVVPVQWKKETMGEAFNSVPMWTTLDGVDVVATENERHIDINNPLDCLSKRMKLDLEHATVDGQSWLANGFQTKVCIYDGNGTDARWLDVNVNNRIMIPDLGAHYKQIQIVRYAVGNADFFKGNNGDLSKADAYTEISGIDYSADKITNIVGAKQNNG